MTEVRLQGLTKRFAGAGGAAVDDLTLDLSPRGVTALLGPSGSGKTTVMKMIAGVVAPTAGDVLFDGASVLALPPERRGAVMVFQSALLFPDMDVAGNVGFGLRMRRRPAREVAARVEEMLHLVGLPGFGARRPFELSGGQAARVALARALIVEPRVLLLDEPLASLDPHLRAEMRDLIRAVQRQTGTTTLIVTHDQQEAVVMADRVALLLGGRLRQCDVPAAFFRRPADAEVARFFGAENFVPGVAESGVFDCALGRLQLPEGARAGRGVATFRPEAVRYGPGTNGFLAEVVDRAFLGTQVRLDLQAGGQRIVAVLPPWAAEGMEAGVQVPVHVPPDALWVLPDDPLSVA